MQSLRRSNSKQHVKAYKAGKHWLYASITVLSLGLGTLATVDSAQADTDAPAATPTRNADPHRSRGQYR